MPSYTELELTVEINQDLSHHIVRLDEWVKVTPGYNPALDASISHSDTHRPAIYPHDDHPFFVGSEAVRLLSVGMDNVDAKYPAWSYNPATRILEINALIRKDWSIVLHFLEWLSPLVDRVLDSDFTHPNDLEGPRRVNLVDGKLEIASSSYTR